MHSCRGSDRVCRWSFGAAGLFVLWKPHRGRWILGHFFGRSASWRRLVIPIYFMYGNRMTMGNRNEVKGRPEFQRMLQDVSEERDGVAFILVFKLSRFGRNAADVLNSLQFIQDYGVNLICVEDGG